MPFLDHSISYYVRRFQFCIKRGCFEDSYMNRYEDENARNLWCCLMVIYVLHNKILGYFYSWIIVVIVVVKYRLDRMSV